MGNKNDPWREDYHLGRVHRRNHYRTLCAATGIILVALVSALVIMAYGCAARSPGQMGVLSRQEVSQARDVTDSRDQAASQKSGGDSVSIQSGDSGALAWIALIVAFLSYPTMRTGRRALWRIRSILRESSP